MKNKYARSGRVADEMDTDLQRGRVDHDVKPHAANRYDWRLELLIDQLPGTFAPPSVGSGSRPRCGSDRPRASY